MYIEYEGRSTSLHATNLGHRDIALGFELTLSSLYFVLHTFDRFKVLDGLHAELWKIEKVR